EADDVHPESQRGVRDLDADGAQPDHPQRAAGELEAHELLLAGLYRRRELLALGLEPAHVIARVADVARGNQQARDDQFLHRVGVRTGRVEHRHPAVAHGLDRDVVDPGPGTADGYHRIGNLEVVHVGGTHEDGVRPGDLRADL